MRTTDPSKAKALLRTDADVPTTPRAELEKCVCRGSGDPREGNRICRGELPLLSLSFPLFASAILSPPPPPSSSLDPGRKQKMGLSPSSSSLSPDCECGLVTFGDTTGVRAEAASVIAQPFSGALAAVGRNECRWTRRQEGVAVPPSLRTCMTLTAHNAALAEVTGWYYSRLTRTIASSNTIHTLHSPLALSLLQSACAVQYPRANEIRNSERPPPARNWVPSAQMRF